MVILKDFQEEDRPNKEYNRMEIMFVLGGLMTMMVVSLALQHTSYCKIKVTEK